MAGRLTIARAGPYATVQDGGRHGYLRFGVTPAGPMDWTAFQTANLTLGNGADAAAVEISIGGLDVACEDEPLLIAFCGGDFFWRRNGVEVPSAARLLLQPGERLTARAGAWGAWTYLAVAGGLDTPVAMGSRATHTRSGIGGLHGRALMDGDSLAVLSAPVEPPLGATEARIDAPWLARREGPVRVVPGPQDDYFSQAGLAAFFSAPFRLTPMADRMAYRLEGPRIEHSRGFNIVSDGVALGGIQVAGDGNPIVQMADRASTGGYPKLGHVIRADIGRLAQMRVGEHCTFARATVEEARAALLALDGDVRTTPRHLTPLRRELTAETLLGANLIGGVVDALQP